MPAKWEAEIRIRRNGRLVKRDSALGDDPASALYAVHNDLELWAQDHHVSRLADTPLDSESA